MDDQHSTRTTVSERPIGCVPEERKDTTGSDTRDKRNHCWNASFKVADVKMGGADSRGEIVDEIYFKRSHYAVYRCARQVVIQYADEEERATEQIGWTADLISLRDKLQYMIAGRKLPGCYRRPIAEAMRLALENKLVPAKEALEGAVQDVMGYKARVGRTLYLLFAGPLAFLASAALIAVSLFLIDSGHLPVGLLLLACSGGSMGALLSIAIALRKRTVAVDDDWKANVVDGMIRLLIGIISAAALFLVLNAGFVANIGTEVMRGDNPNFDAAWQTALIIGFAAGFFERLVPDLLEGTFKQQPKITTSATSN